MPFELKNNRLNDFKRMYGQYYAVLFRFALRYVTAETAEDIIQDVFLEIWKNDTLSHKSINVSYLLTSIHHRCINYLKSQRLKLQYEQQILSESAFQENRYRFSTEKPLMKQEQMDQIYRQLDLLPDKCRHIIKMAYLEGRKSAQIAEMLQLSVRTVEHQLYLGIKALRKALKNNR
jgi:RNA polymerase sigma-70 factor (ECF subfamily)